MATPSPFLLDVRPVLKAGGEPFADIMAAVAQLQPGQTLRLLATFKPVPLFTVMGGSGFAHDVLKQPQAVGAGVPQLRERQRPAPGAVLDRG